MQLESWEIVTGVIALLGLPELIKMGWKSYLDRQKSKDSENKEVTDKVEQKNEEIVALLQTRVVELQDTAEALMIKYQEKEDKYEEMLIQLRRENEELKAQEAELLIKISKAIQALHIAQSYISKDDANIKQLLNELVEDLE